MERGEGRECGGVWVCWRMMSESVGESWRSRRRGPHDARLEMTTCVKKCCVAVDMSPFFRDYMDVSQESPRNAASAIRRIHQ